MLAAILMVGGLGAAAFHPPAAALAYRLGGERPGLAMSVHITGGTLGFSLGPLLFAPFAQRYGLEWTPLLAIPGLLVVAFFLTRVPPMPLHTSPIERVPRAAAVREAARAAVSDHVLRTLTSLSFATFVPVMMTRRGFTVGQAGTVVGAVSLLERPRRILRRPVSRPIRRRAKSSPCRSCWPCRSWSAAPLVSGWLFVVLLCIGGFFLQSTLPVNVASARRWRRSARRPCRR